MNHLRNRIISQTDLEYLKAHRLGLYRRAEEYGWRVATPHLPANLTLADFGIGTPPASEVDEDDDRTYPNGPIDHDLGRRPED